MTAAEPVPRGPRHTHTGRRPTWNEPPARRSRPAVCPRIAREFHGVRRHAGPATGLEVLLARRRVPRRWWWAARTRPRRSPPAARITAPRPGPPGAPGPGAARVSSWQPAELLPRHGLAAVEADQLCPLLGQAGGDEGEELRGVQVPGAVVCRPVTRRQPATGADSDSVVVEDLATAWRASGMIRS